MNAMIRHYMNWYIAAFFALFVSSSASFACTKEFHIAYSDWSRIGGIQATHNKAYGLDFDLMQAIMKEAGCKVSNRFIPNKRLLEAIRHGQIDGTMGASLTVPRQEYAWFTEPYRQEVMAMFMRSNDLPKFLPTKMEDIVTSELRVGLGMGSWHGAKFEEYETGHPEFKTRLLYSDNFLLMFQWLLRRRVDITIMDIHHGYYLLEHTEFLEEIRPHSFYINTNDVHIMLSKKSVTNADATIISKAVGRFRDTPAYYEILAQYSQK